MNRTFAALLISGLAVGCLSPSTKPKPTLNGKVAPQLKNEAAIARQLPLVIPETITEQNHKQKLQAFESELTADRDSGGRAYVDGARK